MGRSARIRKVVSFKLQQNVYILLKELVLSHSTLVFLRTLCTNKDRRTPSRGISGFFFFFFFFTHKYLKLASNVKRVVDCFKRTLRRWPGSVRRISNAGGERNCSVSPTPGVRRGCSRSRVGGREGDEGWRR